MALLMWPWVRAMLVVMGAVAVTPRLLVEAAAKWGLHRVGALPRVFAPDHVSRFQRVLWATYEAGPMVMVPRSSWSAVPAVERSAQSPGTNLANLAAALWVDRATSRLERAWQTTSLSLWLSQHASANAVTAFVATHASFAEGTQGATMAARLFFGVAPEQLTWAQAAWLAARLEHTPPDARRRRETLRRLLATHALTPTEFEAAVTEPLFTAQERR
jgi:Transglycosylase